MGIKCVAFDLDDCLYNGTLLIEKARRASIKLMIDYGLPVDEDYAYKILMEITKEYGSNSERHLDYLIMRLREDPTIQLSQEFNSNKYIAAGIMGYYRQKVKQFYPFKDVQKTLQKLHKKGFKIALITDGKPKKQYDKLFRLKIQDEFDFILISDEVGIKKPNPELFKLFCKEIKLKPEEILYVGDRLEKDVAPANEVGIHTVLIHRGTKYDPNIHAEFENPVINPDFECNDLYQLENFIKIINKGSK